MTSLTPSRLGRSNIESRSIASMMERSPRAPVLRSIAFLAMALSASAATVRSTPLHLEQPLILLHQRVLGLGQNELERGLVEILKCRDDWKAADEFRDQAVFEQILRFDFAKNLALLSILGRDDLGAVTDRARPAARRNDLLEAGERAAAHEKDICGVDLQEFLLRM